jgi:hypothetical protein
MVWKVKMIRREVRLFARGNDGVLLLLRRLMHARLRLLEIAERSLPASASPATIYKNK